MMDAADAAEKHNAAISQRRIGVSSVLVVPGAHDRPTRVSLQLIL
jgi:hypothetical protein